jgi:hypothetical protein
MNHDPMGHDTARECLEAYALGALDEPERSAVAAHVDTCEECRGELALLHDVAAELAPALAFIAPVPRSDVAAQRIRRAIRRRALRSRLATLAVAAGVALLVVAAAWIWRSERTLADERERSNRLLDEQEIIFEVVDSPDRQRIVLRSPGEGDWYGKVFTRPDLPYVVTMGGRLPEPPGDESFHVWLTFANGETVLAGVLKPDDDGFAPLIYIAGDDGPTVIGAEVTAEPPGASAPHGEVLLTGRLEN